jgi:thiol-disulfide isomerase/thioredoxin
MALEFSLRSLIVLLPLRALAACDRQKTEQPQAEVPLGARGPVGKIDTSHKGEDAPATPFLAPDGTPATLSHFRGKPLIVNLWATWCAPCISEMPTLDKLAAEQKDALQLIAVSQDLEGKRAVEPFFAKHKFTMLKPYLDKQNVLPLAYKTDTLPMTVMYDAEGKEQWRVLGGLDWQGAKAKELIGRALSR